jgi:hypothetical protein
VIQNQPWGVASYDKRLLDFGDMKWGDVAEADKIMISHASSVSFSPPKVQQLLWHYDKLKIDMNEIIQKYIFICQNNIKPSETTLQFIPDEIDKCIGIHLRRSDKLTGTKQSAAHTTSNDEYNSIIDNIRKYLDDYVHSCTQDKLYFFVCSEDANYKEIFIGYLRDLCNKYEKKCIICSVKHISDDFKKQYVNIEAVVDFFSLSKCKNIIQGIKHSTFTMMAAMVGNVPMHTFAKHDRNAVLHLWKECLTICDHTGTLGDMKECRNAMQFYPNPQIVTSMKDVSNSYKMLNTPYNRFSRLKP